MGPTGLTAPPFIEVGPTKDCRVDCGLHPYSSWEGVNGNANMHVDTTRWLAAGGWYRYQVYFIGNNQWQTVYCDGNGCGSLDTQDLGTSYSIPYIADGGESGNTSWPIGSFTTSNNQHWTSTWTYWCYTSVTNNVGGAISGCGPSIDWSVSYGP